MTTRNGSNPYPDPATLNVAIQQRAAAMAARLQTLQTLAAGIDGGVAPDAPTIAAGLATEITRLGTYGADPGNPFPS